MNYGLPKNTHVDKNMPKKFFYDHGNFNVKEKEIFTKAIKKITWLYSLKTNNINVDSYKDDEKEFIEIEIFKVELKSDCKIQKISEMIMQLIPYPILIEFELEGKMAFAVEWQRINKNDSTKNTIEEINITNFEIMDHDFENRLNFTNFRYTNFFDMYSDLYHVIIMKIAESKGIKMYSDVSNLNDIIKQVNLIQDEINVERNKIRKETQFNRKVDLNIRIKKMEKKLNKLKQGEL